MRLPEGHFLSYRSSRVHYFVWGSGSRIIFAFHGYGETASTFGFIGEALPGGFMLIAIDLPLHGRTEWKEGLSFTDAQLFEMMTMIAALHGVGAHPLPLHPWRLLGYSMGGRIALQLFENHAESFDKLILLAPDGLKVNFWYRVATGTAAGNLLFRWTMRRPGWLFLLLRLCHWLRFVNPSIYKFAVHYIDDQRVRQELYTRWTVMRCFRPRLGVIAGIIRRGAVPVCLVYGRYDRIIRWERGERFRNRGIGGFCQLVLLETGHQLLRPPFLGELLRVIGG